MLLNIVNTRLQLHGILRNINLIIQINDFPLKQIDTYLDRALFSLSEAILSFYTQRVVLEIFDFKSIIFN